MGEQRVPYVTNQSIRIHYEVEGHGPPLVLQYGQYFPLDIWYELNYVTTLRHDYRLILIDARGHGDSDKPYDPEAYQVDLMVTDIVAVLDDLGIEKAHYMGYSSGGILGLGIATFSPERLYSLIIGGMNPYGEYISRSAWSEAQVRMLENQTPQGFLATLDRFMLNMNLPCFSPRMRTRMLTHDPRALIAWLRQFALWPGYEAILGAMTLPCLLYAGENDGCYVQAQKAAKEMPNARFVSIPNGGHLEGGTWVNVLAPHINELLAGAAST